MPHNNIMPVIDKFLQQSVSHIRQSINDIDDSYNNEWDILAELIQNSVDAIRETNNEKGTISLKVDCQNKSIGIKDDGIGIDKSDIIPLLALFGTNKKNKESSVGEKGVGLKFAMFSCNDFQLKTSTGNNATHVEVKNAYNWKKSTDATDLPLIMDDIENDSIGTEVILNDVQESPIFDLSIEQLKYVLRTRTALGNVNNIFGLSDPDISIELNYTSPNGGFIRESVEFKYLLPIEGLSKREIIDIDEYYTYVREGIRDDLQKRQKLKDKIVYLKKIIPINNRQVYAFACLVPGRATWDTLNLSLKVANPDNIASEDFLHNFSYSTFQPGIFTSVKGMPTGIRIEPPITGSAGTWGSILMIFEDRNLKFDIGRKSIHGKTQKAYQEHARTIFNEIRTNVLKYVSGDVNPESTQWDRDEVFGEIDALLDLNNQNTKFKKSPKDQEASVAAIFFECIGNGKITEISPLVLGYKKKYDLYALWGKKKIVVEFKSQLYKIIKDVNDQIKLFNELDCVVCWDVTDDDRQKFKDVSIGLEEIESGGILNKSNPEFPHATHILRYSNFAKPIYVIDLKSLLNA